MYRGYTKRWRKRWDAGYHKDHLLWLMMDYFIDFAAYYPHKVFRKGAGLVELERGEWIFTERELAEFFGVDRGQIRVRVNMLKDLDFLTHRTTHQMTKIKIINYETYQNQEQSENPQRNPASTQPQPSLNPPLLVTKKGNKEKKEKRSGALKRAAQLPTDFDLSQDMIDFASKSGINGNVQSVFAQFCDHHRAKGSLMLDWKAAWRTWVRNEIKFGKKQPPEQKSALDLYLESVHADQPS